MERNRRIFEDYIGVGVEERWESKILVSSLGFFFGGFHRLQPFLHSVILEGCCSPVAVVVCLGLCIIQKRTIQNFSFLFFCFFLHTMS